MSIKCDYIVNKDPKSLTPEIEESQFDDKKKGEVTWEKLKGPLYRRKIEGGWLVGLFSSNGRHDYSSGVTLNDASCSICFLPDSTSNWEYCNDDWERLGSVKHHRITQLTVPGGMLIRSSYKGGDQNSKYLCAGELVFIKK